MSYSVFWRGFRLFLAVDLILVLGYGAVMALVKYGVMETMPDWISLSSSTSLIDRFQYAKWLMASVLLLVAWQGGKRPLMGAGAVIFAMLLADDSLELHEAVGHALADSFGLPRIAGLRSNDLGEMLAFGVIGLVALGLFLAARQRADRGDRRLVTRFALVFAGLGLVALSMDMASVALFHRIAHESPLHHLTTLASILDDGTELVMASLTLAFALGAAATADAWQPTSARVEQRS